MAKNQTPIQEILGDLNGGAFAHALETVMADVAQSVIRTGKKGKVNINFDMDKVKGTEQQVIISHKIDFAEPTLTGKRGEDSTSQTTVFVSPDGEISLTPKNDTMALFANAE